MGVLTFIIGIFIGSFLNVCICRIPNGESIAFPPSHCTSCGKNIKWYDLIPILSYVLLKGRCRFCNSKVSVNYVLTEIITGILFMGVYYEYGLSFNFIKYATFICILVVIGTIDYNTTDVYFSTTVTGVIFGIIYIIYVKIYGGEIKTYIYGAVIGFGIIALIILITKGMGWGDAEIGLVCGIFLGLKLTLVMIFFSFIFGAILSLILIGLKKKSRKDCIPFGPFMALASIFSIFFGEQILILYLF